MRQRKVKNEEEKLALHEAYLIKDAKRYQGKWHEIFGNQQDIYLELGCGRGQFVMTLAWLNPDKNYIGIEAQSTVALRALEKATVAELKNVVFVSEFITDIKDYFQENELSGIYLNFSDPWPKERHAKRRLTHTRYLKGYEKILKSGSNIEFKSDNDALFGFTVEECKVNHLELLECTDDLHHSQYLAKQVTTEYEDKFKATGKNINYCKVKIEK